MMHFQKQIFRQPANGVASWQGIRARIAQSSRWTLRKYAENSFVIPKFLTSRYYARAWPSCFIASPALKASRLPMKLISPNNWYENGGSVGARNPLPWRTSRNRDAPRSFPFEQVAHVKAMACGLPAKHRRPLSRVSLSEIVAAVLIDNTITWIGRTTVWRILRQDGLRPRFHKAWIFQRDPWSCERAFLVLHLYQRC